MSPEMLLHLICVDKFGVQLEMATSPSRFLLGGEEEVRTGFAFMISDDSQPQQNSHSHDKDARVY